MGSARPPLECEALEFRIPHRNRAVDNLREMGDTPSERGRNCSYDTQGFQRHVSAAPEHLLPGLTSCLDTAIVAALQLVSCCACVRAR